MPDLAFSQAEATRFFREFLTIFLAPIRELRELRDKLTRERTQFRVVTDRASIHHDGATLTLTGIDPGTNTTADAKLYARITGSGPYTITLYKATGGGGGDAVASGSANANATATLTESNSSGLAGTWKFPASVTTTTDDTLIVEIYQDYPARLTKTFTQDGTVEDDGSSRKVAEAAYELAAASVRQAIADILGQLPRFLLSDGTDNPVARGNEFVEAVETALMLDVVDTTRSTDGQIVRYRAGFFERLRLVMQDNTTAQSVVKRVPSAAAAVFSSDNTGLGAVASHTPLEQCRAMRVIFKCVRGADNGYLGVEAFDVQYKFTDGGKERVVSEPRRLTIGVAFQGQFGFGGSAGITLTRTFSKTNDSSHENFVNPSSTAPVVTGARNGNTDDGDIHYKITSEGGSTYTYEFFKSSSLADSQLVAKATGVAASTAFTADQQRSSGLTIVWTSGSAPANTNATGKLELNPFRTSNSNGQPDQFEIVVSVAASPGLIQTLLAEEFDPPARLASATAGSETIEDELLKQGTFPDFLTQDN